MNKSDQIYERLLYIVGSESRSSFAKKAGISDGVFKSLKSSGNLTTKTLLNISEAAGIDPMWLLTGKGPMHPNETSEGLSLEGHDFVKIPRYNATVSAGHGSFNDRAEILDYIPFTLEFINKKLGRSNIDEMSAVEVIGDSMEPTIKDGAIVIIDGNVRNFTDAIGAFVWGGEAYIKRIQKTMVGLQIISDNPQYKPQLITNNEAEQLHMIGKVVWCGQVL